MHAHNVCRRHAAAGFTAVARHSRAYAVRRPLDHRSNRYQQGLAQDSTETEALPYAQALLTGSMLTRLATPALRHPCTLEDYRAMSRTAARVPARLLRYADAVIAAPLKKESRSALIWSALVVGMPCGKPL